MVKHTEGPWFVSGIGVGFEVEDSKGSVVIQSQQVVGDKANETRKANVRLAASAPELLEALESLLAVRGGKGGTKYHADDIARAAIAKAKGDKS